MSDPYTELLALVHPVHDLGKAASLLGWDREVNMPRAADPARIQVMTTLRQLIHARATDPSLGDAISAAEDQLSGADPDSDQAALLRVLRYDYERSRKLPADFVARLARTSGEARGVWQDARAQNDFARFRPWLEQLVALQREQADHYGYPDEPYDALLEGHEQNMRTSEVRALFDAVKAATVPLVAAIAEQGDGPDDGLLHQPFDVARQEQMARRMAEAVGYDFARGHLGTAVHPFASSFGRDDVRITTRWYPDYLSPALFGTLHESGHAIYEQGTAPELARTPLARGASSGIHESQSRLIENLVGRSLPFWRAHYPALQGLFPEQLGPHPVEAFHRAINKVQPSFIRVEADELTYNLHIVLRFELEQRMLAGELAVADLPAAWNEQFRALFGIVPPNDREGVLQDIHWSGPSFGYFPTYALGNLYAAQLYEAATQAEPAIESELAEGRTEALRAWLVEKVHRHGRKYPPAELCRRATGQSLAPDSFIRYARAKFGALYGLD